MKTFETTNESITAFNKRWFGPLRTFALYAGPVCFALALVTSFRNLTAFIITFIVMSIVQGITVYLSRKRSFEDFKQGFIDKDSSATLSIDYDKCIVCYSRTDKEGIHTCNLHVNKIVIDNWWKINIVKLIGKDVDTGEIINLCIFPEYFTPIEEVKRYATVLSTKVMLEN